MRDRRLAKEADRVRRRRDLLTSADRRFVLFRAKLGFDRQRGVDAAAALTYLSFLALFPLTLTAVSALAIAVGRPGADTLILAVVSAIAPPEGVRALCEPLSQLSTIPLPGVGIALGLWAISAYAACFGRVVNAFYGVEEGRTFWRMRLTMLLLSVPLAAGGAVVGVIALTTPKVGRAVARQAQVADPLDLLWQVGKWPLLLVILALVLVFGASIDTEVVRLRQLRQGVAAEAVLQVEQRDLTRHRMLERRRYEAETVGRAIRLGHDRLSREERLAMAWAARAAPPPVPVAGTPALGRPVYRGGMAVETGRVDPESTPSEHAVEQDFTIPEDADYSPGADDAAGSE